MYRRNAFYALFSLTLVGLFFSITGAIGWIPVKSNGVFSGGRWIDAPVWPEIVFGLACLAGAAVAYRVASKDPRLRR